MKIAIVFGGKSLEHDVSIVTAKQIYSVAKTKYDVELIYVDKDDNFKLYQNKNFEFGDFRKQKYLKSVILKDGCIVLQGFCCNKKIKIDCAIVCCHGGSGESGLVESCLLMAKIPVSAGSVFALACSMDKWQTKNMLKALNIPVVDGVQVHKTKNIDELVCQIEEKLSYPVIVKPSSGGSSIGIKIAKNKEELKYALETAFCFDDTCVAESALSEFDEYNQAVLGDGQTSVVSPIEMPTKTDEILSFRDKYLSSNKSKKGMKGLKRQELKLSEKLTKKISNISSQIFRHFGFYGVVRIDYIYDRINRKLYVNEINAIPGSLAIYLFNKKYSSIEFIDKLIEISIKNYTANNKIDKKYITKLF